MIEVGESYTEALERIILGFHAGRITRKTFLKRMAALGCQQAEALELAESWQDE